MNQIAPQTVSVALTSSAAKRVQVLAASEGNPVLMLRLAVSGGGCSGFSYGFSLDGAINGDDRVFEMHGAKLVIDETSLELLKGGQVDYVEDLLGSSFRITNPNAKSTCGCGNSFSA